jgi:hypothetical protein
MEIKNLTAREKLQLAYELAFFPPRLNEFWRSIKDGKLAEENGIAELIRMGLLLHLALPESGYASARALKRLAYYQACSKGFAPETFLKNIASRLGMNMEIEEHYVPGNMIRDIGLPEFSHAVKTL